MLSTRDATAPLTARLPDAAISAWLAAVMADWRAPASRVVRDCIESAPTIDE